MSRSRLVALVFILDIKVGCVMEDLPKIEKVYVILNRDNTNPGENIQTEYEM